MLASPSNLYKYYLPKEHVATYQDEAYPPKHSLPPYGGSKFLENLLVGLKSSEIKVNIGIKTKNRKRESSELIIEHPCAPCAFTCSKRCDRIVLG